MRNRACAKFHQRAGAAPRGVEAGVQAAL